MIPYFFLGGVPYVPYGPLLPSDGVPFDHLLLLSSGVPYAPCFCRAVCPVTT